MGGRGCVLSLSLLYAHILTAALGSVPGPLPYARPRKPGSGPTVQPPPTRPGGARPRKGSFPRGYLCCPLSGNSASYTAPPAKSAPPLPRSRPGGGFQLHKGDFEEQEHRSKGLGPRPATFRDRSWGPSLLGLAEGGSPITCPTQASPQPVMPPLPHNQPPAAAPQSPPP